MRPVTITIRSDNPDAPLYPVQGFAPEAGGPLAVTPYARYGVAGWQRDEARWRITHIPTGYQLGQAEWSTPAEAMAALLRCEPDFPAWPLATGAAGGVATVACRAKFQKAMEVA